jgi:Flp pilus assembly protein TadG
MMLKGWRRRHHDGREAGAVAIEFALLMAFLPLPILALSIVDYGEIMGQATNFSAITRGAADYARGQVVQGNALPTAANLNALLGVPAEVFTTSSFCTCADGSTPTPLPTCPGPGDNNPCGANTDMRVLKYVAVSWSQAYTPSISGTWSFSGSVRRQTVFRTQ